MNEQIRKLELEAIAYVDSIVPAAQRYNDIYYSIVCKRLAELIVRHCADIANSVGEHGYIASKEMLEHFGLEQDSDNDSVDTCPRCGAEWSGTSCGLPYCGWIKGE